MSGTLATASRLAERATVLALVPLVALFTGILITAVFMRYVLGSSFVHAVELTRVAFIWAVFLGAASGVYRLAHIRVTALAGLLPAAPRRVLDVAVLVVMLGFSLLVVWHGVLVTERMAATELPTLAWPQSVLYAAVPTGSAVAALHLLAQLAGMIGPAGRSSA
jgi:TRAP-type C4-dicarboxylate transport system permease small subunit